MRFVTVFGRYMFLFFRCDILHNQFMRQCFCAMLANDTYWWDNLIHHIYAKYTISILKSSMIHLLNQTRKNRSSMIHLQSPIQLKV